MGTLTWSFHIVISKYLDYTQYYMMLLEQCGHIGVRDLVTVLGHVTGLLFCLYVKTFLPSVFNSVAF